MIKRLASSIREYKKDSILTPIFVSCEVLMEVIIPLLMANLIDKGIEVGDMNYIFRMGLVLIVLTIAALVFGALSGKCAAKASAGFAANLRKDMYYNVQNFSFSNIDKFSTAGIVTRLTTDVTNVQNAYMMLIRSAVRCPLMLIFALIMTFTINAKFAGMFFLVIIVLGVGLIAIFKSAHPIFERVFKTYDVLNTVVQENVTGIRVVKSFVREDYEKKKMGKVSDKIFKDFTKAERIVTLNAPLMMFCVYGCMLLIAWFGANFVVGGEMTTGNITSLFTYVMQILMSMMFLSMVAVMIIMARASAERIVEVLEEVSDLQNCENPITEIPDGSVVFDNVNFSYKKNRKFCLSDVNLEIKSGETIGIIGGTGSSKTSLVQLIPRLYDATEGVVKVGGIDVRKYDIESLRNEVSMVLQKNVLFSGTIKENLRWGNENATDEEIVRVCKLAQADDFVSAFPQGYDTHIEQGGSNVSGGQKQRLCIARALLKKPKILILDDSTSAVDTKTDALIRKAMREEIPNTTKFIIAQRISSVEDADKIIVMDGGKVTAFGPHKQLLETSEIYREVYESQTRGGGDDE